MSTNNYFYLCSRELLKQLIAFKSDDANNQFLTITRDNIDVSWILISTSLLLSEHLLKQENIYKMINQTQYTMLENILEKTMWDSDYAKLESYFLDLNNRIVNPFHNLTIEEFEKQIDPESLKEYTNYGCNTSIITNNKLDYKKLIIRIRNSLAHSNYEILDDNYLRIYHFNNYNQLDFNVKINKVIVLTVIDELNELASKHYELFLNEYMTRNDDIHYTNYNLSDEEIINHLMNFNILTKEEIIKIIEQAKKDKEFYPNYEKDNNFTKLTIIYEIILEKIKPFGDYGIILNEIIFNMSKSNKSLDNYFYEKFGFYDYFNSDLFKSSNFTNKKVLQENKFKIILLSYLNSILLYSYNTLNINYSEIDFSKMEIDDEIKRKYIENKYQNIRESFIKLSSQERELHKILQSLNKLELQLSASKEKNEFLLNILPERIKSLKKTYKIEYQKYLMKKNTTKQEMYNKLFEINDIKDNKNLNNNLSKYIINHLRNSLAHGYISFPKGIDFTNLNNIIICFEDYDKKNKESQTFKATIKLGELLNILNNKNTLIALFNVFEVPKEKSR